MGKKLKYPLTVLKNERRELLFYINDKLKKKERKELNKKIREINQVIKILKVINDKTT